MLSPKIEAWLVENGIGKKVKRKTYKNDMSYVINIMENSSNLERDLREYVEDIKKKCGDIVFNVFLNQLRNLAVSNLENNRNKEASKILLEIGYDHKNTGCLNDLAVAYNNGVFGEDKLEEAIKYHLEGIRYGGTSSMDNLGKMYQYGRGVAKDYEIARFLFENAIRRDDKLYSAYNNLGIMYLFGEGVEKNQKIAFNLFMHAAKNGYSECQYRVGHMFYFGQGVEQNKALAANWFKKALRTTDPNVLKWLNDLYERHADDPFWAEYGLLDLN